MSGRSPTQSSLAALRAQGYACWIVELTKGYSCLVDVPGIGDKWTASRCGNHIYAVRTIGGRREYMHRLIAGAKRGEFVDHIDGDTLNNMRANLRVCSHQQNAFNSSKRSSLSGFKGVARHYDHVRWVARLTLSGKNLYLGTFASPEDAARAYDAAARRYYGDFARLNFNG